MEINQRLKEIIEDGDRTQSELAKTIGVNRRQINRWTEENVEMGIYKLKAICEFYNVSADYILGLPKGLQWPRKERR